MIKKLRRKFIIIAMISIAGVMAFYAFAADASQGISMVNGLSETARFIIDNDGKLERVGRDDYSDYDLNFSAEFFFRTRFFSAFVSEDGVRLIQTDSISAFSSDEMIETAELLCSENLKSGRHGNYFYRYEQRDGGKLLVVLDASENYRSFSDTVKTSLLLVVFTVVLVFIPVWLLSGKAIKPEIENAEKQKQFITNASHELKTPLAVIRANTELLELTEGENEWTRSTLSQVDRMNDLIKDLVSLARYEEHRENVIFTDLDVSQAAEDAVRTFRPVSEQNGLELVGEVLPGVRARCDGDGIKQVINILLDNAVKYCDAGGKIVLGVERKSKKILITCSNDYVDGENEDYSRFFDRFYRADESHKIEKPKGGYGIGLSIARNVAEAHRGRISVSWKDGRICFVFEF
ncbi:MAG: HAMP domain-containing histidine kinase [Clostridia bacterium]|nr:HAMP domain-containing histidine kinase [Clostridia bacterium]